MKAKTSSTAQRRESAGKIQAMAEVVKEDPIQDPVRLNLNIEWATMRSLKEQALDERTTVSKIVRRIINEYLSK